MLETRAEERAAGTTITSLRRFGHDFSRIPIHPASAGVIQTKLAVNQPGGKCEQEADSAAKRVMRMPEPRLQRKCACGGTPGSDGECAECKRKRVQRNAAQPSTASAQPSEAPPIVNEVLRSPGRPLDAAIRTDMEPRFGHDFSRVRVHTDSRAAQSARSVNAAAYTVGSDIVFSMGHYAPGTSNGKNLMAHELSHVVQNARSAPGAGISSPGDASEREAESMAGQALSVGSGRNTPGTTGGSATPPFLSRLVSGNFNCAAGTDGASANPLPDVTAMDAQALTFAQGAVGVLNAYSINVAGGHRDATAQVDVAYQNRFGIPPASGAGFLNRLTGTVRPTFNQAFAEELSIMSRRFQLVANLFSQNVIYRCNHGGITFAGCGPINCNNIFAESCAGIGVIFLCPTFWTGNNANQQAAILDHEAMHIILAAVGDTALRGSGGNFRFAECYGSFIADLNGFATNVAACPAPGP